MLWSQVSVYPILRQTKASESKTRNTAQQEGTQTAIWNTHAHLGE
jgi:hypothetical protein